MDKNKEALDADIRTVRERFMVREKTSHQLSNSYFDGAVKALDRVIEAALTNAPEVVTVSDLMIEDEDND